MEDKKSIKELWDDMTEIIDDLNQVKEIVQIPGMKLTVDDISTFNSSMVQITDKIKKWHRDVLRYYL